MCVISSTRRVSGSVTRNADVMWSFYAWLECHCLTENYDKLPALTDRLIKKMEKWLHTLGCGFFILFFAQGLSGDHLAKIGQL